MSNPFEIPLGDEQYQGSSVVASEVVDVFKYVISHGLPREQYMSGTIWKDPEQPGSTFMIVYIDDHDQYGIIELSSGQVSPVVDSWQEMALHLRESGMVFHSNTLLG